MFRATRASCERLTRLLKFIAALCISRRGATTVAGGFEKEKAGYFCAGFLSAVNSKKASSVEICSRNFFSRFRIGF